MITIIIIFTVIMIIIMMIMITIMILKMTKVSLIVQQLADLRE